ncbi:MAG: DUF21 domain-containing protein, partial [Chloroflexota bacterium]|nr:DUF21 domain-containing protein [Chloroflexota bacterium]
MNLEISPLILQLGALVVLLAANGFFVSVEFAYVTVPRPRIDQLVAKGDAAAARVRRLLDDTDRVLAASQIGITVASLGIGWFGENAANELMQIAAARFPGLPFNAGVARGIGFALAFALITSAHVVLGEQAPKTLALRAADRFALFSARAVALFDRVFRPVVSLLDA